MKNQMTKWRSLCLLVRNVSGVAFVIIMAPGADAQPKIVPPASQPAVGNIAASPNLLRVCASSINAPFSTPDGQGFEDRIVKVVGEAMRRKVVFVYTTRPAIYGNYILDSLNFKVRRQIYFGLLPTLIWIAVAWRSSPMTVATVAVTPSASRAAATVSAFFINSTSAVRLGATWIRTPGSGAALIAAPLSPLYIDGYPVFGSSLAQPAAVRIASSILMKRTASWSGDTHKTYCRPENGFSF